MSGHKNFKRLSDDIDSNPERQARVEEIKEEYDRTQRPEPSEDCCDSWPEIAWWFNWFVLESWPELLVMPYLDSGIGRLLVNFCPGCGADKRGVVMALGRLHLNSGDHK